MFNIAHKLLCWRKLSDTKAQAQWFEDQEQPASIKPEEL